MSVFHDDDDVYAPAIDIEVVEVQKVKASGGLNDSNFSCTVCQVTCYSKDFFYKHITGRKHVAALSAVSAPQQPQPTRP